MLSGGTTIFQGIGERVTLAFEFTVGTKRLRCKEVLLQPSLIYQCDVDIRKDLCAMSCSQAARPFSKGLASDVTLAFEFPDGNIITVGAKRLRFAGVLLQPSLIYQCDVDIRKDLCAMSCSRVARQFSKGLAST